ncbi:hypothetical protein SAMN05660860_01075 [Geoalkalibacter ferrihydriticus]|nr:hypothetical protein SAMN05660860_01075 [Geoalkalibacter ferrihydriticus]
MGERGCQALPRALNALKKKQARSTFGLRRKSVQESLEGRLKGAISAWNQACRLKGVSPSTVKCLTETKPSIKLSPQVAARFLE